ncbi:MAG: hypothetical protein ACH346_02885 [Chthoniobacterales bacterium]
MNVTNIPSTTGSTQVDPVSPNQVNNNDSGIVKATKEWFGKKIDWITGSGNNRSWSSFGAWMLGIGHDKTTTYENRTWGGWIAGRGFDHNNKPTRTWSEFGTLFIPNWALGSSKKSDTESDFRVDSNLKKTTQVTRSESLEASLAPDGMQGTVVDHYSAPITIPTQVAGETETSRSNEVPRDTSSHGSSVLEDEDDEGWIGAIDSTWKDNPGKEVTQELTQKTAIDIGTALSE